MHPWCEAFRRYVEKTKIEQVAIARELGIYPSVVSYWMRGSVPRVAMRERVERLTRGKVKASLGRKAA